MERITSRHNATFKQARKLAESARERKASNQFLMDGTRLISAYAANFGLKDATLLVSASGLESPEIRQLLKAAEPEKVLLLDDPLFQAISQVETPEGIAALATTPLVDSRYPDDFRLLLDGVQDPGNLGGLLRTATGAGATSAHLGEGCADPWSPKSLRGGMGAQFVLPLRPHVDLESAIADFGGTIVATSLQGTQSIYEIDLTGSVALIFGSEGRGITEKVAALASHLVHIPMAGNIESLNVAAAAAICCFERQRQRQALASR